MWFPVQGKLEYMGSSLSSLSRLTENFKKFIYEIENNGNLCKL